MLLHIYMNGSNFKMLTISSASKTNQLEPSYSTGVIQNGIVVTENTFQFFIK